jgi:hypothetical protein
VSPEIFCPRAVIPPPAHQRGAKQKNCLFLLEEKIRRAQNQKMQRQFFCEAGRRFAAAGGGQRRFLFLDL